jgi:hypothetical protein
VPFVEIYVPRGLFFGAIWIRKSFPMGNLTTNNANHLQ